MRNVKPHEERRQEILETSARLFFDKGYAKTKITDIIEEIGMSKGIFYYYFESKEDVMNAIIIDMIEKDVADARKIADDKALNAHEKVYRIITQRNSKISKKNHDFMKQFKEVENPEIFIKAIRMGMSKLLPILSEVVEQGIREGVFNLEYPYETIELLMCAHTHQSLIINQRKDAHSRGAYIRMMENSLGAEKGSFNYLRDMMKGCKGVCEND